MGDMYRLQELRDFMGELDPHLETGWISPGPLVRATSSCWVSVEFLATGEPAFFLHWNQGLEQAFLTVGELVERLEYYGVLERED